MSWVSFEAVISQISWFFLCLLYQLLTSIYMYIHIYSCTANSTINSAFLISLTNRFISVAQPPKLMTVSLVSIRIPLPAASARNLRSVFFELEEVYSPSILVARILLVIFLNRNIYFAVLSLDLRLMFSFPWRKRRGRDTRTKWKGWW